MPSTPEVLRNKFRLAGGAHSFDVRSAPEAATQTFKRGDVLGKTSGKVRTNISVGSDLTSSDDEVVGWAMVDASGTTDTDIPYFAANTNIEWCIPVSHGTLSSALTAIADIGSIFTIERTAAGGWTVAIDTTSNPVVEIVDIDPQYAVGTQCGWVWVKVIAAEREVAA